MGLNIKMKPRVDSKGLFSPFSTKRNSIHGFIRGDGSSIIFEFETGAVDKISWVPGNTNLRTPFTKKDSQPNDLLQLTLITGILLVDLETVSESKISSDYVT